MAGRDKGSLGEEIPPVVFGSGRGIRPADFQFGKPMATGFRPLPHRAPIA